MNFKFFRNKYADSVLSSAVYTSRALASTAVFKTLALLRIPESAAAEKSADTFTGLAKTEALFNVNVALSVAIMLRKLQHTQQSLLCQR